MGPFYLTPYNKKQRLLEYSTFSDPHRFGSGLDSESPQPITDTLEGLVRTSARGYALKSSLPHRLAASAERREYN